MCNMEMLEYAFIGDAVHTLFVREQIVKSCNLKMDAINSLANSYCNAFAQAKTLKNIQDVLTDEEKEIVRKTRNVKNKHKAKNVDMLTYKEATCFEALIGFHYTNKNTERLNFLLNSSMQGEK